MNRCYVMRYDLIFFTFCIGMGYGCKSGLITTSNNCYNLNKSAEAQNKAADFTIALANFNEVLKKCDADDAKILASAGKAEAQNGLHQYQEAIASSQLGLKLDKSSIDNLFQKAIAELALGDNESSKADFRSIISLTKKNTNLAQRATIYAKLASMDSREQQWDDAKANIIQAIQLDPSNGDLYILQGDIYSSSLNFSNAMTSYDQAISIQGNSSAPAWKAKVESIIKMNQTKYSTTDVNTLASQMSTSEKVNFCSAVKSGQDRGMKSMNIELMQTALCK